MYRVLVGNFVERDLGMPGASVSRCCPLPLELRTHHVAAPYSFVRIQPSGMPAHWEAGTELGSTNNYFLLAVAEVVARPDAPKSMSSAFSAASQTRCRVRWYLRATFFALKQLTVMSDTDSTEASSMEAVEDGVLGVDIQDIRIGRRRGRGARVDKDDDIDAGGASTAQDAQEGSFRRGRAVRWGFRRGRAVR